MNLQDHLLKKKTAILKRWFNKVIETYPPDTSRFLRKEKDPFANPVGGAISQGIEGLFETVLKGSSPMEAPPFLDQVIRIRAIQEFSPSEAVGFVFSLKKAIREELKHEIGDSSISKELSALESTIDELALLSFDIYMQCREQLYAIKSNEIRNRAFMLLEKSDYVSGTPEAEGPPEHGNGNGLT
jgi:hypothetical protein